jgi:hypothetical protein
LNGERLAVNGRTMRAHTTLATSDGKIPGSAEWASMAAEGRHTALPLITLGQMQGGDKINTSASNIVNIYLNLPEKADESFFAAMFRALKNSLLAIYVSVPLYQNESTVIAIRRTLRHAHLIR